MILEGELEDVLRTKPRYSTARRDALRSREFGRAEKINLGKQPKEVPVPFAYGDRPLSRWNDERYQIKLDKQDRSDDYSGDKRNLETRLKSHKEQKSRNQGAPPNTTDMMDGEDFFQRDQLVKIEKDLQQVISQINSVGPVWDFEEESHNQNKFESILRDCKRVLLYIKKNKKSTVVNDLFRQVVEKYKAADELVYA